MKFKRKYTITAILGAFEVARANYYRWCAKGIEKLLSAKEEAIIELCKRTKYRNGHRKIRALLKQESKIKLHRNTVQSIIQKHNLQCRIKPKCKWKLQGESIIVAHDLLKRNYNASKPNQKWVTDINYVQYGSTTKYLSTIMDLFNNEIVAYKFYNHQQKPLFSNALKAALVASNDLEGVIIHLAQGSVYTSYA